MREKRGWRPINTSSKEDEMKDEMRDATSGSAGHSGGDSSRPDTQLSSSIEE